VEVLHFPDDPRPTRWGQPVLAVGNFDGLHRGHLKIIERVSRRARERGGTAAALTFDPHPPRIVRPDKAPPVLMTKAQKLEAFERAGVQGVAVVRFTPELSRWEPEEFVRTVLVDWLRVAEVWVGSNFLFGHDRSGNFSLLRALGLRYGFRAEKIDPVRYKDFVVSSTRIRRLIAEGRVDEAGALLGHHYFVDGTVVRGAGRGRRQGFPTLEIHVEPAERLVQRWGRFEPAHPEAATIRPRPVRRAEEPGVVSRPSSSATCGSPTGPARGTEPETARGSVTGAGTASSGSSAG